MNKADHTRNTSERITGGTNEIQEWLGHSDIGTTSNVYSHVDSESKKLSAEAIAKALSE